MAVNAERALQSAYAPIEGTVTALAGDVGTTSEVPTITGGSALTDPARDAVRRWSIVNTHATNSLAVCFVALGTAAGSEDTTYGRIIPPQQCWEFSTKNLRVLVVASAASTTYSGLVNDT